MELSKIKVVHISTSINGGAGTAAYRIHAALLNNNIDSHFLSLDEKNGKDLLASSVIKSTRKKSDLLLVKVLQKIKWRINHHINFNFFITKKARLIYDFNKLQKLLKCEIATLPFSEYDILQNEFVQNADIIHLHWVSNLLDFPSFFKNNKKAIVWTMHDMNPFQGIFHYKGDEVRNKNLSYNLDTKILKLKQHYIENSLSKISYVCPSFWLLNNAQKSISFNSLDGICIRNPLNFELYSLVELSHLKSELKIPTDNTIFLFVAETVSNNRKGFDILVKALKSLQNKSITLLVIGKIYNLDIIGIDIKFLGSIKNEAVLKNYYSLADAFILPSREDNLPNVMLESLACGTPVLSFNVGGMSEIIENGFNGLKADIIGVADLVKIINLFIVTKKQFSANKIQNFASENFAFPTIANKYKSLYTSLLKN